MAVALLLAHFLRRRRDVPLAAALWFFAALIFCCGLGALLDSVHYWWPEHRWSSYWQLVTGVVALATAAAAAYLLPRALRLPGWGALQKSVARARHQREAFLRAASHVAIGSASRT